MTTQEFEDFLDDTDSSFVALEEIQKRIKIPTKQLPYYADEKFSPKLNKQIKRLVEAMAFCKDGGCNKVLIKTTKSNGAFYIKTKCLKCLKNDSNGFGLEAFNVMKDYFNTIDITYHKDEHLFNLWTQSAEYMMRKQSAAHYYATHTPIPFFQTNINYDSYKFYLKTDDWKIKRANILNRDQNTCVLSLCNVCEHKATQVHHLTYKRVYRERASDLISVCKSCHQTLHEVLPQFKLYTEEK